MAKNNNFKFNALNLFINPTSANDWVILYAAALNVFFFTFNSSKKIQVLTIRYHNM